LVAELAQVYARSGARVTVGGSQGSYAAPSTVTYRVASSLPPASEWGFGTTQSEGPRITMFMATLLPGATVQRDSRLYAPAATGAVPAKSF
jgi:hypothetical protein